MFSITAFSSTSVKGCYLHFQTLKLKQQSLWIECKMGEIINLHLSERTFIYPYFLKQFYLQKTLYTHWFLKYKNYTKHKYVNPSKCCFQYLEHLIHCPESLSFNPHIICISAWSRAWNIMFRWGNFIPSFWHRCPDSILHFSEGGHVRIPS